MSHREQWHTQNSGKRLFSLRNQGNILTVIVTFTVIVARRTSATIMLGMGQDSVKRGSFSIFIENWFIFNSGKLNYYIPKANCLD